jgi:hypothetical protein
MAAIAVRFFFTSRPHGAIAQLGERVVRNDEVGGSIPPGSTNLRRPLGRQVVEQTVPARSLKIEPHFPVNFGGRFSMKLATPSRKSLPRSAITISRLASIVASASVWNGTS